MSDFEAQTLCGVDQACAGYAASEDGFVTFFAMIGYLQPDRKYHTHLAHAYWNPSGEPAPEPYTCPTGVGEGKYCTNVETAGACRYYIEVFSLHRSSDTTCEQYI